MHRRGWKSEQFAKAHFLKQGWRFRAHRWVTPFGEVDLCFQRGRDLLLVEVKSLSSPDWAAYRVPSKQLARLSRVVSWCAAQSQPAHLVVAFVGPSGEVEVVEDVF